jgi:hypothetical protein
MRLLHSGWELRLFGSSVIDAHPAGWQFTTHCHSRIMAQESIVS